MSIMHIFAKFWRDKWYNIFNPIICIINTKIHQYSKFYCWSVPTIPIMDRSDIISTVTNCKPYMNDTLDDLMGNARLHESLFRICTIGCCPQRSVLGVPAFRKTQPMEHARSILSRSSYGRATGSDEASRPDPTWRPRNNLRIMRTLRGCSVRLPARAVPS